MKEFNYISNLDEVTDFDKEYEIYWYGNNVTVKEDKEKYYIDINTGLGVGVYEKEDWLCHLISDGKRTLKISVSGEAEFDEDDYDEEDEYDDYGTY